MPATNNIEQILPKEYMKQMQGSANNPQEAVKSALFFISSLLTASNALYAEQAGQAGGAKKMESAKPATSQNDNTAQYTSLAKMMAALATKLGDIIVEMSKSQENKSELDAQISQGQLASLKTEYQQLQSAVNKMHSEQSSSSKWGIFGKVLTGVLGGIGILISLLLWQPEIAVLIAATVILQETGTMNKMSDELAKVFEQIPGMPTNVAKILAKVTIILVVVAASGAGAAGSAALAPAVSDGVASLTSTLGSTVAEEVGEDAADSAADDAADAADNTAKTPSKTRAIVRSAVMGGAQATTAVNPAENIAATLPIHNKIAKEVVTDVLVILQDLLALLATLGTYYGLREVASVNPLTNTMIYSKAMNAAFIGEQIFGILGVMPAAAQGAYFIEQGNQQETITSVNQETYYMNRILKAVGKGENVSNKDFSQLFKDLGAMIKDLSSLADGQKAVARVLEQQI